MRDHEPRRSSGESDGALPEEQRTRAQQEAWLEEHRQPPSSHPLQAEQARVQQALDALLPLC